MKCKAIRKAACMTRTGAPVMMETSRVTRAVSPALTVAFFAGRGSWERLLDPLSLDFFDLDFLDSGALDCPEREVLGSVLNRLREMPLVVLHHVV